MLSQGSLDDFSDLKRSEGSERTEGGRSFSAFQKPFKLLNNKVDVGQKEEKEIKAHNIADM